jgi:hypothetical protein
MAALPGECGGIACSARLRSSGITRVAGSPGLLTGQQCGMSPTSINEMTWPMSRCA